jgi:hypothetical protein
MCTALSEAVVVQEISKALADVLLSIDAGLKRGFVQAKNTGEIRGDADPKALAWLASAALHSL